MFLIFYQLQSTVVFFMRLVTGFSENLDKQKGLIYMHTKHFGDRLENITDKSLKHTLARYIEKNNITEEELFLHFQKVLACIEVDSAGSMVCKPVKTSIKSKK